MTISLFQRLFAFRSFILLTALAGCAAPGLAQDSLQVKVEGILKEGLQLHGSKDYEGAIAKFSEAIKLAPGTGLIYVARGIAYMGKQDDDNAFRDFSKALEVGVANKGSELYARRLRALINTRKGKHQEAIDDLDIVIAQATPETKDFALRGESKFKLGKHSDAMPDFNKALELDPKNEMALFSRAKIYLALKMPEKALPDITAAINIRPDGPNYYAVRADVNKQLGKNEAADADLKKEAELRARPKQ